MTKNQQATELEAKAAEVNALFGIHIQQPTPERKDRIFESAAGFRDSLKRFRTLNLTGQEKLRVNRLETQFDNNMSLINKTTDTSEEDEKVRAEFSKLRNELDDLLDEQMQFQATKELVQAEENALVAVNRSRYVLISLLLCGLLVGILAAFLIRRGIVRPLRQLVAGTHIFGRGTLDHRIEVNSRDEVYDLATAFNMMAERRQRSEHAVLHLNRVLEDRVNERTAELTQAVENLGAKEKNLRESEERYRAVVEQATEGINLFDSENGRIK